MTVQTSGRARPGVRRTGAGSLSAGDWVAGANALLERETVRGVKIATLCARLGVTKGSFYWHFRSRQELLDAILADWRRRMTLDVITRVSQVANSVEGVLRGTLALIRKRRPGRQSGIERSIRDWARTEARAQAVLTEVDETRLKFFEGLFLQRGFPPEEARLRGYAAYALMMGDSILKGTVGEAIDTERYLDRTVELLLAGQQPPPAGHGAHPQAMAPVGRPDKPATRDNGREKKA